MALLVVAGRPLLLELSRMRGAAAIEQRRHALALRWLNLGTWIDDDDAELQFLLARVHRRLEDFDKTRTHLERAHDLGWNVEELEREQLIALAQTYQYDELKGRWPELFQFAGSDGPEISDAFVVGCLNEFRIRDAERVLAAWESDFPADPQPHFRRGTLAETRLAWGDAVTHYRKVLALDPDRVDARQRLGHALSQLLKYEEAAGEFERVLAEHPDDTKACVGLAICSFKQGDLDYARTLFEKVLEREPDHAIALAELANLELQANQP